VYLNYICKWHYYNIFICLRKLTYYILNYYTYAFNNDVTLAEGAENKFVWRINEIYRTMSPKVKKIVPEKAVRETDERKSWWVSVVDKAHSKGQPE